METEATKFGRTAIVETRKSVNGPNSTGARQDVRLWGFLIILMMIAITSTVGLEARFLIDRGNSGYAIFLVAMFFAFTLGLAIFQTVRALNSGKVVLKGRRGRQPVLEAPEALANAVRDRSAALGLQNVLDIGYLPRTWNLVDAYVAGIGRHQTIVLTGGMMQLFYSSVPERQAQFRFVIDHELGHVAHGDTTVLYLASAAISVFSLALPIKLVLLWWLGLDGMVGLYDSAFPRVFDQSVIFGFLTGPGPNLLMELTAQRPAPAFALSFLLGFFLLMLTGSDLPLRNDRSPPGVHGGCFCQSRLSGHPQRGPSASRPVVDNRFAARAAARFQGGNPLASKTVGAAQRCG